MQQVPEFWSWLIHMGEKGIIKIPREMYGELSAGNDDIPEWLRQQDVKDALRWEEEHNFDNVQRVLLECYGEDLNEVELEKIGMDPFLISSALDAPGRCVVTAEVSASSKKRANRKVPDVCDDLGVLWLPKYELTRELNFRTDWKP